MSHIHPQRTSHARTAGRALPLMLLGGAALLGCNSHQSSSLQTHPGSNAAPVFAKSPSNEFARSDDPCNLLEPKEVEAVLGALAVPPYRGNGPAMPYPSGDSCVYETANYRYITFEVVREGGARAYSLAGMTRKLMKSGAGETGSNIRKTFKLDDGTDIAGEWDEASLMPLNCCIFQALRGDALITIDFTASAATLRQAADLVDAAYRRFDHPLSIDGGAGVAAAKAFDKTRPQPTDVCKLLTRAEVEAIIGPLPKEPAAQGHDSCTYEITPQQQYELLVRWRGGYAQWRSDRHVHGIGFATVTQSVKDYVGAGDGKPSADAAGPPPAAAGDAPASAADTPESVTDDGLHYVAVKRDVEVAVNDRFSDPVKAKALVAAALAKL